VARPGQATQAKRQRERAKQEKRKAKEERRAQRKERNASIIAPVVGPGMDPDLIGIVPGPQKPLVD